MRKGRRRFQIGQERIDRIGRADRTDRIEEPKMPQMTPMFEWPGKTTNPSSIQSIDELLMYLARGTSSIHDDDPFVQQAARLADQIIASAAANPSLLADPKLWMACHVRRAKLRSEQRRRSRQLLQ